MDRSELRLKLFKVDELEEKSSKNDLNAPFDYCNLSYESPYGNIEVRRSLKELSISIPIGVTLIVKLPNQDVKMFESGNYKIDF